VETLPLLAPRRSSKRLPLLPFYFGSLTCRACSARAQMASTKLEGGMQAQSHHGHSAVVMSRHITKPHLPTVSWSDEATIISLFAESTCPSSSSRNDLSRNKLNGRSYCATFNNRKILQLLQPRSILKIHLSFLWHQTHNPNPILQSKPFPSKENNPIFLWFLHFEDPANQIGQGDSGWWSGGAQW